MQKNELYELVQVLRDKQVYLTGLIANGLVTHQQGDPFLPELYELQDQINLQIRELLVQIPDLDPLMLAIFDERHNAHRVNLLLSMNGIMATQ